MPKSFVLAEKGGTACTCCVLGHVLPAAVPVHPFTSALLLEGDFFETCSITRLRRYLK